MEAMGPMEELPVATVSAAAAASVAEDQLKRRAIVFSLAGSNDGGKKTALEAEMPKLKYSEVAARSAGFTPEEERMMVEHLPTVRYIARRIHERLPQHVDIEDLVSAGVLGLMDAFQKFNPEKNVQFRSYAQFRIRGAILDSLRTLDWSPRDLRRKGRAIEQAIRALTVRLGRTPSEQEIASELQMELGDYQQLLGE